MVSSTGKKLQSLDTNNLIKNPQTGMYNIKTNSAKVEIKSQKVEAPKVTPGIPVPASTNKITSYNISPKTNTVVTIQPSSTAGTKPEEIKQEEPKKSYFNLILYYLIVLHLIIIYFYLEKNKVFEKIKNPFKKAENLKQKNTKVSPNNNSKRH